MKGNKWVDPAKRPPRDSTMKIEGDFGRFTEFMKRVVKTPIPKKEKQPTSASSSPGPAVS